MAEGSRFQRSGQDCRVIKPVQNSLKDKVMTDPGNLRLDRRLKESTVVPFFSELVRDRSGDVAASSGEVSFRP